MSVPTYKRNTSSLEYVENVLQLVKFTISRCTKFPKRWNFLISKPLSGSTIELYKLILQIKETYNVKTEYEFFLRQQNIGEALGILDLITTLLDIAYSENKDLFSENVWFQWSQFIVKERKLLNGVKQKNKFSKCKDQTETFESEVQSAERGFVAHTLTTPLTSLTSTITDPCPSPIRTTLTEFAPDSSKNVRRSKQKSETGNRR